MRLLAITLILFLSVQTAFASYTKGYYRSNGTYVNGYYKTNANSTKLDNYSTKGNYNPYTNKRGTVNPYSYNYNYSTNFNRRSY